MDGNEVVEPRFVEVYHPCCHCEERSDVAI